MADTATTNTQQRTRAATTTPTLMDRVAAASAVVEQDGKRMFRMKSGQMVELPPDMSIFDAVKLETEALAAEQKLGKGPPPKDVPDVKKEAKAKEKKQEKKKDGPGKKKGAGDKKGSGKAKPGGEGKGGKHVIKGKVGAWLMAKGAPVVARGQSKLQQMKVNEQKHDDAATKLSQTEKAVVPPVIEGQSTSNSGQVTAVDSKTPPQPNEQAANASLDQAIENNIPRSIEDVDNFKKSNRAGVMSAAAAVAVQTDKNDVTKTFGDIKQTPPPVKSDVVPEALPPEEQAGVTPKMDLGAGAVAPLQPEHTDVSKFTKEGDSKLKEEGVTQEQLDMVDSGDLAEANKEKKGMEKKAKSEPAAIQQFAKSETKKVDTELDKEEQKGKEELKKERKNKLNATKQKQQGTKTDIEKKREEVANKINKIYETAQASVTKKLADLETTAMKRFDDGNAVATRTFEDTVKRELQAFKDDRYSGFWGWARRAKDWLLGMDDLPQVKAIFERNRAAFVTSVNNLVAEITADNKRVIEECKQELANARTQIKEFVDKLGPELRDAGRAAQEDMNSKLDELDKTVAKKEEDLQNKLKDKQQAAIKAIDEKIEKMKEEMSGALAKLGKLLLLAAKKFFTWALEKFGFSLAEIESIINKGAAVLKAIFTGPIQFVKNLVNAAVTGFKNFGKNFLKHLKDALFEWLTGSLEGLTLPKVWDFKGIISIALQMIGISYQNIRKHMVTVMGEQVVGGLEKTFTLVKTLITDGPIAAWEQLKEMAADMRDAFVDAVKDFIKTKIIEQAIQWVISIFVPGAGIIKAIVGIYDIIVFFIQKAKQIMQMIGNFLSSIGEIAAGNIGAAADAMENGLARGLSLVINFLARLLHLDGITAKIREAIKKIRDKVDGVMLRVAKWIADKAKKLIAPVTGKIDQLKEKGKEKLEAMFAWWKTKRKFSTPDGKTHHIYYHGSDQSAKLMVASDPKGVEDLVQDRLAAKPAPNDKQKTALKMALSKKKALDDYINRYKKGTTDNHQQTQQLQGQIDSLLDDIRTYLINGGALTKTDPPLSNVTYTMQAGKSHVVKAEPLTSLPGNTTGAPSSDAAAPFPKGWDLASGVNSMSYILGADNKPKTTSTGKLKLSSPWKKVHLLNHNLHGPAAIWNFIPAITDVNSSFLHLVETPMKDAVKKGHILSFQVNVKYYGSNDPIALLNKETQKTYDAKTSDYPERIHGHIGVKETPEAPYKIEPFQFPGTELPKSADASFSFTIERLKILIKTKIERMVKDKITDPPSWGVFYPDTLDSYMRERIGADNLNMLGQYYYDTARDLGIPNRNYEAKRNKAVQKKT